MVAIYTPLSTIVLSFVSSNFYEDTCIRLVIKLLFAATIVGHLD